MKTFFNILIVVAVFSFFVFLGKNWAKISSWWNKPKEGQKCIYASEPAYIEGVIQNGKCVVKNFHQNNSGDPGNNPPAPANPPAAANDTLEVSNPNGAYMYYQSLSPASQAFIYGKSNVLIPYGTKLKLVKTWQTNLSTQPFGGYYETDYKQYGPTSGFFDIKDIKKA